MFQFEPVGSHPLFAAASNSSFYIIFALGPGFIARISRLFSTFIQEFSFEDSVSEPFEYSDYAASASCCSISLSTSTTAFAVWMPKKMYRISVSFFLALTRRKE